MPEHNSRQVNFALVQITTEQLDLSMDLFNEEQPVTMSAGLDFGIQSSQNLLKVLFKTTFHQESAPFITIEAGCIFAIDPDSWNLFCDEEEGYFTLPKNFAAHLATLTSGTARGILHSRTEHTAMNRFFIPVTNIEAMIPEKISLQLVEGE